jgi:ribosome biogenesis protein BMS1
VVLDINLDIIFLRAWYPVKPKKYYNPVQSLLVDSKQWTGMRTNGQIRRDENIKLEQNKDSFYKPIERKERVFNKLKVPKRLQTALPFASKPKLMKKQSKPTLLTRRAVVMEPEEKKIHTLIQRINTISNEKQRKKKIKNQEVHAAFLKKREGVEAMDAKMSKERRKEHYKAEG